MENGSTVTGKVVGGETKPNPTLMVYFKSRFVLVGCPDCDPKELIKKIVEIKILSVNDLASRGELVKVVQDQSYN